MTKKKYSIEQVVKASPAILYKFVTEATGLIQWFADAVDIHDGTYIFAWNGEAEQAVVLDQKENEYIRFQWENDKEDTYFEFRVEKDEITGGTALIITDFADEKELEDQQRLWESQLQELTKRMGG